MTERKEQELENKIELYSFLTSVFMTLPDEKFLDSLLSLAWEESDSRGCNEIAAYAKEIQGRDHEEVLLELGRDRAKLVRGASNDGMEPPYESMYVKSEAANTSIGSLNRFYGDVGYEVSEDTKEAPDQIGVEFSFMELMLRRELEAVQAGDDDTATQCEEVRRHFMAQHLGRWAHDYASAMRNHAQTGFYRGIALLIEETV